MNMVHGDGLGFPEKKAVRGAMEGREMETEVSLAKAHLFLSLLLLGCFWIGTSAVIEPASKKNDFGG